MDFFILKIYCLLLVFDLNLNHYYLKIRLKIAFLENVLKCRFVDLSLQTRRIPKKQ